MKLSRLATIAAAAAMSAGVLAGCGAANGNTGTNTGTNGNTGTNTGANAGSTATSAAQTPDPTKSATTPDPTPSDPTPRETSGETSDPDDESTSTKKVVWKTADRVVSFLAPKGWQDGKWDTFDGYFRTDQRRVNLRVWAGDLDELARVGDKMRKEVKASGGTIVNEKAPTFTLPGDVQEPATGIYYTYKDEDTGAPMEGVVWIVGRNVQMLTELHTPRGQLEAKWERYALQAIQSWRDQH